MSEPTTSLDICIQRLDVLCSVTEQVLQPGGRPSKGDLRNLHRAAQKVVDAYLREAVMQRKEVKSVNDSC